MSSSIKYFMGITNQINCPLYATGDQLTLTDSALHLPTGKGACLILVRDITEILCHFKNTPQDVKNDRTFSCSGCQGIIKFKQLELSEVPQQTSPTGEIDFSGRLQALPPEELIQALNMNQKTGLLHLNFADSNASISFKTGSMVAASYGTKKNTEAFFSILANRQGTFQFYENHPDLDEVGDTAIGDFMNLLMEGLQKIDEQEK